ncbi:MAG: PTS sugar transporter subunit IIB [Bacilli bacterium]
MNIMLVCSAGMSTSMLVTKMEQAAKDKGIDAKIWAIPEAKVTSELEKADVVLLGPQVRFILNKVKGYADPKGIPVDVINTVHYGTMNGAAVLETALAMKK